MVFLLVVAGPVMAQPAEAPPSQSAAPNVATPDKASAPVAGIADAAVSSSDAAAAPAWRDRIEQMLRLGRDRLSMASAGLAARDWTPLLLVLFNGLLAIFTFRLWRSNSALIEGLREQSRDLKDSFAQSLAVARDAADAARKSAEVASLQARALVGVELPRLELSAVHLAYSDQSVRQALRAPAVEVSFTNYGRTTAFIIERCVEMKLLQALPPEPAYSTTETLHVVTAVESGKSVAASAHLGELTEQQIQMVLAGLSAVWVYGFVRFRDFLGMEHKLGFCLRWAPPYREASIGGAFVQEDPGGYIYRTDDAAPAAPAQSRQAEPYPGPRLAPAAE